MIPPWIIAFGILAGISCHAHSTAISMSWRLMMPGEDAAVLLYCACASILAGAAVRETTVHVKNKPQTQSIFTMAWTLQNDLSSSCMLKYSCEQNILKGCETHHLTASLLAIDLAVLWFQERASGLCWFLKQKSLDIFSLLSFSVK